MKREFRTEPQKHKWFGGSNPAKKTEEVQRETGRDGERALSRKRTRERFNTGSTELG